MAWIGKKIPCGEEDRMKVQREQLLLYAVTDRTWVGGSTLADQVEAAIRGGATMVQYREKDRERPDRREEALRLQAVCRRYRIPFLINDDVALAREIGADGVHVGQDDMPAAEARRLLGPEKIIGVTAKTRQQALDAEAAGADYLGCGAVFGTETKTDTKPLELASLNRIGESVSIPIVAIGGICRDNIGRLAGTKIAGVAVVSGIFREPDAESAARELKELARRIING